MLMLHAGAEAIDYDGLRQLETPTATPTHVPIPHHRIVDMLRYSLDYYGHEITEENHGVTPDGARYFGLLTLKSTYGDYTDTVGIRNSHDKKFPVGVSFGSRVFVCDNLAFIGEHVIRRKHTANALRDVMYLIGEIVDSLQDERLAQHRKVLTYQGTPLDDYQADHLIMEMYRQDVINLQRIPDVLKQWEEPDHDWGMKSVWRLFNAATYALNGRVIESPTMTTRLHTICDEAIAA